MVQPMESNSQPGYASLLAEVIRVLTAAARLSRPSWDGVGDERREPVNWAEFVSLALAGAAANVGHVVAVLAGRPGSGDAEGVRQLLVSTVGDDDQFLRRTEPVEVDVYVDEILLDEGVWTAYDDAADELARRDEALSAGTSEPLTPHRNVGVTPSPTGSTVSRRSASRTGRRTGRRCASTSKRLRRSSRT